MNLYHAHEHVQTVREEAQDLYDRGIFDAFLSPYPTVPLSAHVRLLNVQGIPKLRGTGRWTPSDVSRLLRRVQEMQEEEEDDDFDF